MAKRPHKSYRIVPQKDLTYGVQISVGRSMPSTVTPFATEAQAHVWIAEQQDTDLRTAVSRLGEAAKCELKKRGK
jgi:hypothetical protein